MPNSPTHQGNAPDSFSRRTLFSILPATAFGCVGCARAMACAQMPQTPPLEHSWTEKADVTWEEMFRFAYQKDLIPLLKYLGEQLGREELVQMLQKASDEIVRKKTAGRPPAVRDLTTRFEPGESSSPNPSRPRGRGRGKISGGFRIPGQKMPLGDCVSQRTCCGYRICHDLLSRFCRGEGTQPEAATHPHPDVDAGRRQLQPTIRDGRLTRWRCSFACRCFRDEGSFAHRPPFEAQPRREFRAAVCTGSATA